MAEAHARYLGQPGPTDVLTFDLADTPVRRRAGLGRPSSRALDVDLLVNVDEAARQARARVHGVEREVLLYVVHGVLHCLGHDDRAREAARRMHALEDAVLRAVGVGATYARPVVGAARR